MFIDYAKIFVRSGNGGNGGCSFRREKFVPHGGPDGGDGGNGGSVVATASTRVTTLLDLKYRRHYEAESGAPGQKANRHGRTGADVTITVPVGTVIRCADTILADLVTPEQRVIVAKGGKGGKGNARFATSTNRAPRTFEEGMPGEELHLDLELKLLADVGLVGFPNAGKSTLISTLSAARPEIADYPFTTLQPHLGVVPMGEYDSFVMADIPGLIQGAHRGKGLGHQFLKHIQRTRFLLYLIDVSDWTTDDPVSTLRVLQEELSAFDLTLGKRAFAVVGTKIDAQGNGQRRREIECYCRDQQVTFFPISSATREGLDTLRTFMAQRLQEIEAA
ncbi:MAG: GTPase ObgE [Nitrospira sp. SB0677_bin_15]|nr:GTPase ObgE [Nitrospira sp. SB0667_bin_9]MYD31462.1 GTPase ObgE [Nitrospira sp. SB0661_bin_20]MYG40697.1 GTPase ObgE [Nitrospira sp. SB0677_bin_15]MYH01334.1 GTPase ObgE [Nitrospira sp. SB0675_bin_23]MYJ22810.1 GTPase ObgE [Nitrospira sp. SB0673_bin_12]